VSATRRHAEALGAELAELRARVEALEAERRRPAADEDDAELLALAARCADGRAFPAGALLALAVADDAGGRLLADLGIGSARSAAAWCRRVRNRDLGGLRLVRGPRRGAGYSWRVVADRVV